MTEYLVLVLSQEGGPTWHQHATVQARSARAAIKASLKENEAEPQRMYVAVPSRSWKPLRVSVETKTALKFS